MSGGGGRIILAAATVIVAAAVIAGLVVLGSPRAERRQRLDGVRVSDLQTIERLVSSFARLHGALPDNMQALMKQPGYAVPRGDPESGTAYEYRPLGPRSFQLCATFDTDSANGPPSGDYALSFNAAWAHGRGRHCFELHTVPAPR